MGVESESGHHGGNSLKGVMRLVVKNRDGDVLAEGFISDSELTYDPNPDFIVTIE
ncbi:hypothetical protein JMJ58_19430 [Haloterrigena salifodinae]|uniref:Uncharacterized protein n=1 Tax=Haloterrigena salifodinae TaxID=2675099 RepID=A0A8T8E0K0_9EURY|nr:hypothetical protein [Haloterrigena salifodinae]QRV15053.1 hypothetical protein JMJ58_19430 [Haloterrigena salifodinae]